MNETSPRGTVCVFPLPCECIFKSFDWPFLRELGKGLPPLTTLYPDGGDSKKSTCISPVKSIDNLIDEDTVISDNIIFSEESFSLITFRIKTHLTCYTAGGQEYFDISLNSNKYLTHILVLSLPDRSFIYHLLLLLFIPIPYTLCKDVFGKQVEKRFEQIFVD